MRLIKILLVALILLPLAVSEVRGDNVSDACIATRQWWYHGGTYPRDYDVRVLGGSSRETSALSTEASFWIGILNLQRSGDFGDDERRRYQESLIIRASDRGFPLARVWMMQRLVGLSRTFGLPTLEYACVMVLHGLGSQGEPEAFAAISQVVRTREPVTEKRLRVARQYAMQAVGLKHLRGYTELGAIDFLLEDPTESLKNYRIAADAGDGPAAYALGQWYLDHPTLPDAAAKAEKYLRNASKKGVTEARLPLAELVWRQGKTRVTDVLAWNLLSEARVSSKAAYLRQGIAYAYGEYGRDVNPSMAMSIFNDIAKEGYAPAHRELAYGYLLGMHYPTDRPIADFTQAAEHLKLAASLGDVEAKRLTAYLTVEYGKTLDAIKAQQLSGK